MDSIRISAAQFEHRNGDKEYNLSRIEELSEKAFNQGSRIILFHECSVTGYTFTRKLSRDQMLDLAEYVPDGDSVTRLTRIAEKNDIVILAGLFEKDHNNKIFKTCVCVGKNGLVAKHRKLHPLQRLYNRPRTLLQWNWVTLILLSNY
jgi:predicted amidohydrolase